MRKVLLCLSHFTDEDTEAQGSWKSLGQGLTAWKSCINDSKPDSVTRESLPLIITICCLQKKKKYIYIYIYICTNRLVLLSAMSAMKKNKAGERGWWERALYVGRSGKASQRGHIWAETWRSEGERRVDIWAKAIQAEGSTVQRPTLGVFREPQGGQRWRSRVSKW